MPIISGLIVSIDAFFIGISLGMQERCRFLYLAAINTFLFGLCVLGFFIARQIHEMVLFDPYKIVGFAFIALGGWTIVQYFVFKNISLKTFSLVGFVMSFEAMIITMGLTIIFLPNSTLVIPITVALAHFVYSALSFYLTRLKYFRKIPAALSNIISGLALILCGLMALFLEIGV